MKINLILLSTVLLTLLQFPTKAQKPYLIQGKINGLSDGMVITLMSNEGNLLSTVASDTVKAGKFQFSAPVQETTKYALMSFSTGFPNQWLDVWVKPGSKVMIEGTGMLLKTWKVSSDLAEQKDLQHFTDASRRQIDELQELSVSENALFAQREGADAAVRARTKKGIDSLRAVGDSIQKIVNKHEIQVLKASTKKGSVWMDVLKGLANVAKYSNDSIVRAESIALYRSLPEAQRSGNEAMEIYQLLYPPVTVKIGEKIADTLLRDLAGSTHQLSDYKGKYLLIDFWSIGCGPCVAAMPELKRLHESRNENLMVISFSLDQKAETWKKASAELKVEWTDLSDGKGMTGLASKYGVSGIPHYILISPESVLLDSWVGYSEGLLEKKVAQFVKTTAAGPLPQAH